MLGNWPAVSDASCICVSNQMSGEMDSLRNRRIELLRGMQGSQSNPPEWRSLPPRCHHTLKRRSALSGNAEAAPVRLKEEKMDALEAGPTAPSLPVLSSVDPPPAPSPAPADPPPVRSASVPLMPVSIKEEPRSPVHVGTEPDPPARAHSTTPDLRPAPPPASSPGTFTTGNPLFLLLLFPTTLVIHTRSFRHPPPPTEKPRAPPSRIYVGGL